MNLTSISLENGYLNTLTLSEMPAVQYRSSSGSGFVKLPLERTDVIDFFNALREGEPGKGTIEDFCIYDEESMWQFLPSNISSYFFISLALIRSVVEVIERTQPSHIETFKSNERYGFLWNSAIKAVARDCNIELRFRGSGVKSAKAFPALLNFPLSRWSLVELKRWRQRRNFYRRMARLDPSRCRPPEKTGKKLLFLTFARHWQRDPESADRYFDEQIYPVLPSLRALGWQEFIGIDCPYTQNLERVADVFASRVAQAEPDIVWRGFYSVAVPDSQVAQARRHFSRQFRRFLEDNQALGRFRYRGVDLVSVLKPVLHHAFVRILPENVRMRLAARVMLAAERPDAVLLTYETGPYQRAYVVEARRLGIPVIGLMHGVISSRNSHYMHSGIATERQIPPHGFSVPDVTCVWGPVFKKVLTDTGYYPGTSVAITGSWQYDCFFSLRSSVGGEKAGSDDQFADGELSVLICSSRQESLRFVRASLGALAGFPGVRSKVKPHPLEDRVPMTQLLREAGSGRAELCDKPIQPALVEADLVVTQPSTVVYEAILLGKALVLLNMTQNDGFENVIASGACICIEDPGEMPHVIKKLMEDKSFRLQLEQARKRFVKDCFFKLDGQAGARVADIIEGLSAPDAAANQNNGGKDD